MNDFEDTRHLIEKANKIVEATSETFHALAVADQILRKSIISLQYFELDISTFLPHYVVARLDGEYSVRELRDILTALEDVEKLL